MNSMLIHCWWWYSDNAEDVDIIKDLVASSFGIGSVCFHPFKLKNLWSIIIIPPLTKKMIEFTKMPQMKSQRSLNMMVWILKKFVFEFGEGRWVQWIYLHNGFLMIRKEG